MFDSLIMLDACFAALAKSRRSLNSRVKLVNFLKPWYSIVNYINNILICLQKNSSLPLGLDVLLDLSFKTNRKTTLKALRTFKKLKYIDNPKLVEEACLTTLKDK